jgi:hypothetical protein
MSDYENFRGEFRERFKKDELLGIARILQIDVKRSMRKYVLKKGTC